jgi:L-lactate dehydrogenase complex protein LldG
VGTTLANNRGAREQVLSRVRSALGKRADATALAADAEDYVSRHATGPRPRMAPDVVAQFITRATDMASTVRRLSDLREVPSAVAQYVDAMDLPPALATHKSRTGVCWPELGPLDWAGAGLDIEARPTTGHDRLGITGCFCAIAETGTVVFTTGANTPTGTTLLPDTHIAIVQSARIVAGMEDAFALIRHGHAQMPRAVNLISGPSRTGDIEQTIVLGAHGPYRLHFLLIG